MPVYRLGRNGGAFLGFVPKVFRINGLRTFFFDPLLAAEPAVPGRQRRRISR